MPERKGEAELIERHSGLVRSIVKRFLPRCRGSGADADDLFQIGCIGLLKAVRSYDASLGTQFSTYAVPKILGEIRRFFRDDGLIKIGRSLKEDAVRVSAARSAYVARYGCEPTLSEIAAATELSPEDVAAAAEAAYAVGSCAVVGQEELERIPTGDEDALAERLDLDAAVRSLPERERAVIRLRYDRGLTQAKVGKLLGMSQVQVCRAEAKAVKSLREHVMTT